MCAISTCIYMRRQVLPPRCDAASSHRLPPPRVGAFVAITALVEGVKLSMLSSPTDMTPGRADSVSTLFIDSIMQPRACTAPGSAGTGRMERASVERQPHSQIAEMRECLDAHMYIHVEYSP
jgi:hypothetical protein